PRRRTMAPPTMARVAARRGPAARRARMRRWVAVVAARRATFPVRTPRWEQAEQEQEEPPTAWAGREAPRPWPTPSRAAAAPARRRCPLAWLRAFRGRCCFRYRYSRAPLPSGVAA